VEGAVGRLHRGELEVMVLAQELGADLVVMDDLLARRKAQRLGLRVVGTVGVLLLAHQQGALPPREAERKLAELTQNHGMHLSLQRFWRRFSETFAGRPLARLERQKRHRKVVALAAGTRAVGLQVILVL